MLRWSGRDFAGDESSAAIERAAGSAGLDRQVGFVRAYLGATEEETQRRAGVRLRRRGPAHP